MASQLEVNHAELHRVPGEAQPRFLSIIDTEMLGKAAGGILSLPSLFFSTLFTGASREMLCIWVWVFIRLWNISHVPNTMHDKLHR